MGIEEGGILDMATLYFRIYSIGLIFQFMYNAIAAMLRGIGDSKATLYFLLASAALNIALDLLFVVVFKTGVVGTAVATVIAQVLCMVISFVYMFKKYPVFRFKRSELVFSREKCAVIIKIGVPSALQMGAISAGNLLIQRLVNSFGMTLMDGFTAGLRIENYVMLPLIGMNAGIANFTGQNVGAGELGRVRRGLFRTLIAGMGAAFGLSAITYIFATPLSGLFGIGGDSLERAVSYIHVVAPFFIIFSIHTITNGVIQGSGDSTFAALGSLSNLATRVILSYIFVLGFGKGYVYIWWSIPISWTAGTIFALARFFSGRWKQKSIVKHDGAIELEESAETADT
jgi:putative MATE family efflux protein